MRNKTRIGNNRGIALLITLGVISVLIAVTLELNRRARSTTESLAVSKDRFTLSQIAASGVHIAMAVLIQDKNEDPPSGLDSIQENWADPEFLNEVITAFPFESGKLTLKISDELGRIQVNTIVKFPGGIEANDPQMFLWDRFLNLVKDSGSGFDDLEPESIVSSIKDWLDSKDDDAITGLNGAESDYYRNLDPPYECKNGPLANPEELVLIKGITPELYYGVEGLFGISNYMTTLLGPLTDGGDGYHSGRININTADLPVIAALMPSGDEILAAEIYKYREETSASAYLHDLSISTWYKNAPGCEEVKIDGSLITTVSDFFRINAEAASDLATVTITAVVQRTQAAVSGKWTCKVLSWETE
jgi:general secretion pathway protein K